MSVSRVMPKVALAPSGPPVGAAREAQATACAVQHSAATTSWHYLPPQWAPPGGEDD